jgi:hypothetical protein
VSVHHLQIDREQPRRCAPSAPLLAEAPDTAQAMSSTETLMLTFAEPHQKNIRTSNAMNTLRRFLYAPRPAHKDSYNYLIGLRGFFVVQSFLFIFLQVFAPAAVAHTPNALNAPSSTLHKALKFVSILFWNDGMIYSAFILLSARTICLPFMTTCEGGTTSIAGSVFRRGLRLWLPVAVALAISTSVFHAVGYHHIDVFAQKTGNLSIFVPYRIDTTLVYFNSVFNLFWVTTKYSDQAGSYAFPGQMMWAINVIYQQR